MTVRLQQFYEYLSVFATAYYILYYAQMTLLPGVGLQGAKTKKNILYEER